jgi:hypothetical protein
MSSYASALCGEPPRPPSQRERGFSQRSVARCPTAWVTDARRLALRLAQNIGQVAEVRAATPRLHRRPAAAAIARHGAEHPADPAHQLRGATRGTRPIHTLMSAERLVTLTGAGGCGKIWLAAQVVADQAERWPGGRVVGRARCGHRSDAGRRAGRLEDRRAGRVRSRSGAVPGRAVAGPSPAGVPGQLRAGARGTRKRALNWTPRERLSRRM